MKKSLNKIKYIATPINIDNIIKQLKDLLDDAENTSKAIDRDFFDKEIETLIEKLKEEKYSNPIVFEEYMHNRSGKYIIYCRNEKHIENIISKSKELFGKVNSNIEISSIGLNTADSKKEKIIEDFKNNDNTDTLKLMFVNPKNYDDESISKFDGIIVLNANSRSIQEDAEQIKKILNNTSDSTSIIIQNLDSVRGIRVFNSVGEKVKQDLNIELDFIISPAALEIEKVRREISSRGMSNKFKLALMKQYKEETNEGIKAETKFKGYYLGSLKSNLRQRDFSGKLKIDIELRKQYEEEGILGDRKRRQRKTDIEKYNMLMGFRSKNPDVKINPETVDEFGNPLGVYRNYLQTSINSGKTDLTPEQIKILKENNIIHPKKEEKQQIIEKYKINENLYNKIVSKYSSIENFIKLYKDGKIDFGSDEVNKVGIVLSRKELPIKKKEYYIQLVSDMAKKDILKNTHKFIIAEEFDEIFESLSEKEKYVLNQRYDENGKKKKTYDIIAKELGFCREYIKQIHFGALGKMYEKLPVYDIVGLKVEGITLAKRVKELESMSFEEWKRYELDKSVDILDISDLSKIKLKKNGFNKIVNLLGENTSDELDKILGLGKKKKNQILEQTYNTLSNITEERKNLETEQLKEKLKQINIRVIAYKRGNLKHITENIFDKEAILLPSIVEQGSLELKKQEKMQMQEALENLEDEIETQDKKTDKLEAILEEEGISIKKDRKKGEE